MAARNSCSFPTFRSFDTPARSNRAPWRLCGREFALFGDGRTVRGDGLHYARAQIAAIGLAAKPLCDPISHAEACLAADSICSRSEPLPTNVETFSVRIQLTAVFGTYCSTKCRNTT